MGEWGTRRFRGDHAMTELIIDADAHLTEPPDVWTSRVAAKDLDHVPQVRRSDDGKDEWVLEGEPFYTIGATATKAVGLNAPASPISRPVASASRQRFRSTQFHPVSAAASSATTMNGSR